MTGIWAQMALVFGLALIATLVCNKLRISTALSEIIVGMLARAIFSVTVGVETARNFPPSKCRKAIVSVVRLVFGSGATLYFTPPRTFVCTTLASTTTSGVVLGTRYP